MSSFGRRDDYIPVDIEKGEEENPSKIAKGAKDEKIEKLQEQVQEVSTIMQQGIDKIVERGSNLENLQDRSDFLANNAIEFRTGARRVQQKMWWQNMRINIIIGMVVLVIIIIIITTRS